MPGGFQLKKPFQRHKSERLQVEIGFYFILLCYFSESVSEPMLISVNTTHVCSQEQADLYLNVKKHPLESGNASHRAAERSSRNTAKKSLFHEEWELEEWGSGPTTDKRKEGVWYRGIFSKVGLQIGDKHTFCLLKLAPQCFLAKWCMKSTLVSVL